MASAAHRRVSCEKNIPARGARQTEHAGLAFQLMAFDSVPVAPRPQPSGGMVFFNRQELRLILEVYGRGVRSGHWRDYAITGLKESAVFSIFQRTSEAALYRIEKRPALARRQGAWLVTGHAGQVLRRGHELEHVVRLFEGGRFAAE
jgi:hypothetical protein